MRASVNGCDLFYSRTGAGPVIVLIHGFPLDHTIWTPQIQFLSEDYTVLAPDLRGHGQSQVTPGTYIMELLADDVHALLSSLEVDQVVLGGLSMGGYVAFEFVRRYPSMLKGLILLDTKAEPDTPEARERREQQAQTALREGSLGLVEQLLPRMFTQKTAAANPALVERTREVMMRVSPVAITASLRGMALRPDSTRVLSGIALPTLIIVGREDLVTPVSEAQKMAEGIRGSELVVIPEAAHLTTLERPDEVNAAIQRFLGTIR